MVVLETDTVPISITANPEAGINIVVMIANRGRRVIRTVHLALFPPGPAVTVNKVPMSSSPGRGTVQGRIGKKQP